MLQYLDFIYESDENGKNDDIPQFDESKEKKMKSEHGNVKLRMTSRLKKILKSLESNRRTKNIAESFLKNIRKLPTDISFFDLVENNNNYFSFLPKNRVIGMDRKKDEKGKMRLNAYKSNQREEMRIGRIINKLFPKKFPQREIEIFINEYRSEHDMIMGNIDIELVSGKDIAYWYDYKNYNQENGTTLNNSCMKNVDKNRFSIYVDNPDQVKMAIYTRNGKLESRALVWETDKGIYMDRVYYTKDHLANAFYKYAENNRWLHRNMDDLPKMTVELEHNKMDYVRNQPYFDTFRYLPDKGILVNKY